MRIAWSTESERDNDFFQVFHSTNGIDWEIIATVLGAGMSSTTRNYTALHQTAQPGLNYHKLVQQDFDCTRESFPPIAIQSKSPCKLAGRFNMSGQEVPEGYNGLVIEQYSDGCLEMRMNPY
jgi:hypothetical protein